MENSFFSPPGEQETIYHLRVRLLVVGQHEYICLSTY